MFYLFPNVSIWSLKKLFQKFQVSAINELERIATLLKYFIEVFLEELASQENQVEFFIMNKYILRKVML